MCGVWSHRQWNNRPEGWASKGAHQCGCVALGLRPPRSSLPKVLAPQYARDVWGMDAVWPLLPRWRRSGTAAQALMLMLEFTVRDTATGVYDRARRVVPLAPY
jgi:hypothetical protein